MSEQRIEILQTGSETLQRKRGKLEIVISANHTEIFFHASESDDPNGEAFPHIEIERLASNGISLAFDNGIESDSGEAEAINFTYRGGYDPETGEGEA